jgi:hypothetical protein
MFKSLSRSCTQCFLKAYNHINEKRSSIGGAAVAIIEKYIKTLGYDAEEVKLWCRWAKRIDGPIFYKKPTPQTCPTDIKHKDYIVSALAIRLSFI